MPITQPPVVPKTTSGRFFRFAREAAQYGVQGTLVIDEPIFSVDPSPQQETWDNAPETGTTADSIGQFQTTRYEQFTVRLSTRVHGLGGYAGAWMMGPVTYTPPGSPPGLHALSPHPTSNLLNTASCWYRVSSEGTDATLTKQMLASVVSSVHYTFAQNADVSCEVQFNSLWPSNAAAPAPNVWIGADASPTVSGQVETHLMGESGTFVIVGSSGSAYTTKVQSGDVTLSRTVQAAFDATAHDPYYLKAGKLSFMGNLVVVFEGYGAGTVEDDFRTHKPGGTFATPNTLRFTDADGNYLEFVSYPWYLTAWSLDHSGQYIVANISFRATNDPVKNRATTPVLTLCNLNIRNNLGIAMVAA